MLKCWANLSRVLQTWIHLMYYSNIVVEKMTDECALPFGDVGFLICFCEISYMLSFPKNVFQQTHFQCFNLALFMSLTKGNGMLLWNSMLRVTQNPHIINWICFNTMDYSSTWHWTQLLPATCLLTITHQTICLNRDQLISGCNKCGKQILNVVCF